jgi:phosphatidate cytidylyltransferase
MLKQRVITALVLLAIFIPTFYCKDPGPFFVLVLLLVAVGAWEWARLTGFGQVASILAASACAFACVGVWWSGCLAQPLRGLWWVTGLAWVMGVAWVLSGGVSAWAERDRRLRLLVGLLVLSVAWTAAARARVIGVNLLLSILALSWAADISAYFVGRAWGGRVFPAKLAPTISPGKSWEGVVGGALGVLILALLWQWIDAHWALTVPSLYSRAERWGAPGFVLAVVLLTAMSVAGDLMESLVKRSAGAKDSSGLLPGHGGVLDRLDALLPTLPLALLICTA